MEELRNLRQMASLAGGRFNQYDGDDFVLPQIFKDKVKEINSNTITYNRYSAIIETRGTQNGILNIFMPNQWFYIASYFTDFYNELQKYKKYALKVAPKERLKELNGKQLSESELNIIRNLDLDEASKNYLVRFITEYSWWGGAKTIDRGDFYVSPILSNANLVNASQSFVADLCAFLADKQELVKAIIDGEEVNYKESIQSNILSSLQQIYYGAPGTGKSHIINVQVCNESVIRTTFHPDSDYSTFVGCYKPTTKVVKMRDLAGHVIKENGVELTEDRIVYEFVDQAFLQAYIKAWNFYDAKYEEIKNQFLVIEEINRGNCAQIFGDLFQLLDRNRWGFSDYPIKADNDICKQLAKAFSLLEISQERKDRINACYKGSEDIVQQVLSGEILLLPDNFYIWATMNTSDQSLFPIDSAFKRRWDWQYMPISKGRENGKDMNWSIIANDNEYDWWSFLTKINEQIGSTTNSEDKKLGFFFCKAVDGKISADTFVGKVIFYLWNDVFKDFGFDNAIFNDEDGSTLSFDKFYSTENGRVLVRKDKVEKFLKNLGVDVFKEIDYEPEETLEPVEPEEQNEVAELSGDTEHSELERTRYRYWGDFLKYINQTVYKDIFNTEKRNPVYKKFYDFGIGSSETNLYIGYDEDVTVVGYWVKSKSLYDRFVSYKSVIEQSCGKLKWIEINKACKIIKEFSFRGKSQEEQFKLMLDEIVRMRELFIKYVK